MPCDPARAGLRSQIGACVPVSPAMLAELAQSESLITAGLLETVVFPRSTDGVSALARWSSRHPVPLIGWGAGASL